MSYEIPARRLMRQITIRVNLTGVTTARVRLWLGVWVLRLAAVVMGCGIRIDRTDTP